MATYFDQREYGTFILELFQHWSSVQNGEERVGESQDEGNQKEENAGERLYHVDQHQREYAEVCEDLLSFIIIKTWVVSFYEEPTMQ